MYTHTYMYILFHILFSYSLLKNIEDSPVCYTIVPCWLPIFYIIVFILRDSSTHGHHPDGQY